MTGLSTNFNVTPYFDDFDETKNYHRVLFKPQIPVQARELTQLQTILQNQIARFGDSIYKNGSIIAGCAITSRPVIEFVRVKDFYSGNSTFVDVSLFANCMIESVTSGLRAAVVTVASGTEAAYPATNRIYFQYLNSGNNAGVETKTFANNETLRVYTFPRSSNVYVGSTGNTAGGLAITTYSNTAANTYTVNTAVGVSVGDGIVYQKGFFIKVYPNTVIVNDDFTAAGNSVVGFQTSEKVLTSDNDTSLLDNALGYPNYTAPGADRLKLTATLTSLTATQYANTADFTPIVTYNNGNVILKNEDPEYSRLGDELSRREEETSGSFVIKPFTVDTVANTVNTSYLQAKVSSGIGYALGQRVELIKTAGIDVRRGTDTAVGTSQLFATNYGNYVFVKEVAGNFDFTNVESVDIYDTVQTALTNKNFNTGAVTGTKVGTANIRACTYVSGTPGTPTAVYALYLFNIAMLTGKSFANDAKAFNFNGTLKGFADIVTVGGQANIQNGERRRLVWGFGKVGLKSLKDGSNNTNTQYYVRTKTTGTLATDGTISLTIASSHAGGTDKLPYGVGVVGDGNETRFVVIVNANTQTANIAGTLSVNTTTVNVVGSGTSLSTRFSVGEYIKVGGTDVRRVVTVPNATFMTVDSAFSVVNAAANFAKYYPSGYIVPLSDTLVGTRTVSQTSNTTCTINTGASIAGVALTGTAPVTVYHDIIRTNTVPALKTINENVYVKIDTSNNAATNIGPWVLGLPDVHKLKNIFVGASTFSNTNTDLLSSFYLDTGQKDTHYDVAKLYLKPGASIAAGSKLFVCLDHFKANTTAGVGFFTVASYPVDDANTANTTAITTSQIPLYQSETGDSYALRDSVDFRPYVTATANSVANGDPSNTFITTNPVVASSFTLDAAGAYVPSPDQTFQSDITYYLGRKDIIYFTSSGSIKTKEGVPSDTPRAPDQPSDGMAIAILDIKPYPSLSSPEQSSILAENRQAKQIIRDSGYLTQIAIITNRRYTMRDIGVLDSRISNLEYYMSLSLLEKAATDLQIPDVNGLNRFKNGIFVDPFTSHSLGDVSNPEYKVAIDDAVGIARPYFNTETVELELSSLTNAQQTGRLITLPYTSVAFISQPRASKYRNAAPVAFSWAGNAILYPNYDHNVDKVADASVQVSIDLASQWQDFANSPWGTQYGQWRTTSTSSVASTASTATSSLFGTTTTSTTTTQTTTNIQRDGQKLNVNLTNTTYDLGNYVTDISVQPYIRSIEIAFIARQLRPSTTVYAYFDDVNVTQYCAAGTVNNSITDTSNPNIVSRTAAYGSGLKTDATGVLYGKFLIPATTFRVGERRFRLCDVPNLVTGANAITTSCSATFVASNFAVTTQSMTLTTITPEISYSSTSEKSAVTTATSATNVSFVPNPVVVPTVQAFSPGDQQRQFEGNAHDPIAQAFEVVLPASAAGCFVTSLNIYLQKKTFDSLNGITVYICEMENGYPNTSRILPYSRKWLAPSAVSISNDASVPTTFTFESPVYLGNNMKYAFVVVPDGGDPDYLVWFAELGGTDVSTGQQIFSQPYTQTAFLSASQTTWASLPTEYIKFDLNRANFTQQSGDVYFRNQHDDFLNVNTLTYANSSVSIQVGDYVYKALSTTPGNVNTAVVGTVQFVDTTNNKLYLNATTGNFTTGNVQVHRTSTANGAANSGTYIASANVASLSNLRVNAIVPRFASITPGGTKLYYDYTGTSTAYAKDSSATKIVAETETEMFDYERMIASWSNEVTNMSSNSSCIIHATLAADSAYVSPVIDLVRSNVMAIGNLIDTTAANTYNEYFSYGNVQTKYLSKPVVLAAGNDAEDIKVYVTAYRPVGSDVLVYVRFLASDDGSALTDKTWTKLTVDNGTIYSDYRNTADYVEYSYSVPATQPDGSTVLDYQSHVIPTTAAYLAANSVTYKDSTGSSYFRFKTFAVKVVLVSDTTARVPRLNDLRAIALQY